MSDQGGAAPQGATRNAAGGAAFDLGARHRLVQLAITATLSDRVYTTAGSETAALIAAAQAVSPEFLAKAAIYTHEQGHMKEAPALLLAILSRRDPALFARAFARVITTGKMARALVRALRSGIAGRRSLGTRPKAMVQNWLNGLDDQALLAAAVGNSPSLADLIRMVHPKPDSPERAAAYAWFLGQPADPACLPPALRALVAFRQNPVGKLPDVPFQYLVGLPLSPAQWAALARTSSWQVLRQGLNMFQAKGAFGVKGCVDHVASVLRDPARIRAARVLPYQIIATLAALSPDCDPRLRDALHDACDIALANVPKLAGHIAICPDVSGSMSGPVTGRRKGATTAVRCLDVAALMAAAMLRQNPRALVLPFDTEVHEVSINPKAPLPETVAKLALNGGDTDCTVPLRHLLSRAEAPDLVILISDNQSWAGPAHRGAAGYFLSVWDQLRAINPKARLVCIDIQPYGTAPAPNRPDVLNLGGFSDTVFDVIAAYAEDRLGPQQWLEVIEGVSL